ncbi:flagellin N-terminal helical domain-containing protein [Rossellomorea sp. LJF3]|uniref:flagellin N-terminal helical domain-containing protein n=1 Tax=Rossellomorea sp. LJF3 TaxID=3126099 RepID=UPI00300C8665
MRINHNIAALNTYNKLNSASGAQSKSMEKLSSGLRINRAGDDAAGLAISEKMRGQIRGLDMASKNAQDGISMIQTAEGALNETHSILQRMRELSVQASNDTNTSDDRAEIQKEIDQLNQEVNRVAETTEFNTKKLLDGSSGLKVGDGSVVGSANSSSDTQTGTYNVSVTSLATAASDATVGAVAATDTVNGSGTLTINGTDVNVAATDTVQDVMEKINSIGGVTASIESGTFTIKSDDVGSDASLSISADGDNIISASDAWNTTAAAESGTNAVIGTLTDPDSTDITGDMVISDNTVTLKTGDGKGLTFKALEAGSTTIDVGGALSLQIGSNSGQTMNITMNDMGAQSLGISNIDVTSVKGASDAIDALDKAIQSVSAERSKLGAYQNRLDHTINNLGTSSENLTAAESRIRDVDYALAA